MKHVGCASEHFSRTWHTDRGVWVHLSGAWVQGMQPSQAVMRGWVSGCPEASEGRVGIQNVGTRSMRASGWWHAECEHMLTE
eukprot:1152216-Pelagomonas_calceolata.AAC.8